MNRRGFLSGLLAAPAIIRTPGLLMAVRPLVVGNGIALMAIAHPVAYGINDLYLSEASIARIWTEIKDISGNPIRSFWPLPNPIRTVAWLEPL